jgi:hypothetical protein
VKFDNAKLYRWLRLSMPGGATGEPAGAIFSTAFDIGTLCRKMLNRGTLNGRRYHSVQAVKQMSAIQTGVVPVNTQEAYALGWSVKLKDEEGPSIGSFGHLGARRTAM